MKSEILMVMLKNSNCSLVTKIDSNEYVDLWFH